MDLWKKNQNDESRFLKDDMNSAGVSLICGPKDCRAYYVVFTDGEILKKRKQQSDTKPAAKPVTVAKKSGPSKNTITSFNKEFCKYVNHYTNKARKIEAEKKKTKMVQSTIS